ncbi:hypothetical protein C8R47DRAFT_1064380 [Mycena vitilis]|nr:hypothetical protein C8R47DRAFT_1064380 [Mycena vitilis]
MVVDCGLIGKRHTSSADLNVPRLSTSGGREIAASSAIIARIACCKATASRRSAIYHPFQFRRWLEQHKTGIPPPEDLFGGAPHVPGLWHSYRNTDGSWGPEGGIMDASRWLPARRVDDWSWHTPPLARRPGHPDPNWDGTPIPKTPGKGKRRKLRRHEAERHLALFHDAQSRAVGWETGTGWGGDWLTEPQWEMRLAEPRAALERAREALAVYYIMGVFRARPTSLDIFAAPLDVVHVWHPSGWRDCEPFAVGFARDIFQDVWEVLRGGAGGAPRRRRISSNGMQAYDWVVALPRDPRSQLGRIADLFER